MPFSKKKLEKAKMRDRIVEVEVPELKEFFNADEKPVFTVKALNGEEFAKVNDAHERSKKIETIFSALFSNVKSEAAQAVREHFGLSTESLPDDYTRRVEVLMQGCVEPQLDAQLSSKIMKSFPTAGYKITNKILEISGHGLIVGESRDSGNVTMSESA